MSFAVHAFAEDEAPARRLADVLGLPFRAVAAHVFPDGEVLPQVSPGDETVLAYAGLDRPNGKLVRLLLACDAWRRAGVRRLVLVAPYMCYLRQDAVFSPGQPLSRDVIGGLLGAQFDRIVTVEPHLHRTADLGPVFAPASTTAVSAAEALGEALGAAGNPLVVGPDEESEPWARKVAGVLGCDHAVLRKVRLGDRRVRLILPPELEVRGRRVALIDDICSSGGTLAEALRLFAGLGAAALEVAVVHALFDAAAGRKLAKAGAGRVISTDSCAHSTNAVALAPLLARALAEEFVA